MSSSRTELNYRPELDGLRAIAVMPVIFYHAGLELFKGGFAGVDVFFVISGFLITRIILDGLRSGTFSLKTFYERRARRILPVLFTVLLVSFPIALYVMPYQDLVSFSSSVISTLTFSSNIYFWWDSGYWGADNHFKPLLHTWSLSVEEQFYLLYPILMIGLFALPRSRALAWIMLLCVASFGLSLALVPISPTANFFFLPTRAWELLAGGIAAFRVFGVKSESRAGCSIVINQIMALLGLALILSAFFFVEESSFWPGWYTLLPVMGAVMVILFAVPGTLVFSLLSHRIMVAVGLISYSLYLWHQPIFTFARFWFLDELGLIETMLLLSLTFLASALSYKFVESPLRRKTSLSFSRFLYYALALSICLVISSLLIQTEDAKKIIFARDSTVLDAEFFRPNYGLSRSCDYSVAKEFPSKDCQTSDSPEILVWGDSFAMHLIDGILRSSRDVRLIQVTKSACGPLFGIAVISDEYGIDWAEDCLELSEQLENWVVKNSSVRYVVLGSPFSQFLSEKARLLLSSGTVIPSNQFVVSQKLDQSIQFFKSRGIQVILVAPPPSNGKDLGRCLQKAYRRGLSGACDFEHGDLLPGRAIAYEFLERFSSSAKVISLKDILCTDGLCKAELDGVPLYRDKGHLSVVGSAKLGEKMELYELIAR